MTDKLLVIILSGPGQEDKAKQGLIFTRDAKKLGMIGSIIVMFYGSGVEWLAFDADKEIRELLDELKSLNVPMVACSANIRELGLDLDVQEHGVKLIGAAVYVSDLLREGYATLTF